MILTFIIIFLVLSAFFSGAEIAFISANKLGIEVLKNRGHKRGKILAGFYENPKDFLTTMLVGNNITLVVFTILATNLLYPYFEPVFGSATRIVQIFLLTIIVLIFGEFLPKTFFRLFPNQVLLLFTYPLIIFKFILKIPTWFITGLSNLIIKYVVRAPIEYKNLTITRLDLEHYIDFNVSDSAKIVETDMFKNALNLNQLQVRDCLIPRTEIVFIDQKAKVEDLLKVIKESNHSRIIVTDGDIENVKGYVHHQQLLGMPKSIKSMIIEVPFVPEAMPAKDLMLRFKNEETNIACVVDEFGGIAGIITLEDILEEIFGDIIDEHDQDEYIEVQKSANEFIFSGRLEIDYLNDKYDSLNLPEGEYQTLSGYLIMTSGTIPKSKDVITLGDYRFFLESVSDKKIELVRLIKLTPGKTED